MVTTMQVWNVSLETIDWYTQRFTSDPSCFRDFTKTYYGIETRKSDKMWGELLDGPDYLKFILYYKEMIASTNNNLAYSMSPDFVNYLNGKTEGCTKWFVSEDKLEESLINYAVECLCRYYKEFADWESPLTLGVETTSMMMEQAPTVTTLPYNPTSERLPVDELPSLARLDRFMVYTGMTTDETDPKIKHTKMKETMEQIIVKQREEKILREHQAVEDYESSKKKRKTIPPSELAKVPDTISEDMKDDMFNYKVVTENFTKYKDKTKMMDMIWQHASLRGFPTEKSVQEKPHYYVRMTERGARSSGL